MDPLLAKALKYYRDHYNYPWAVLKIVAAGPVSVGAGLHIQFDDQAPKVSDLLLDDHQSALLAAVASHSAQNLVGCGSAIYWGFRTFGPSDKYAQRRAKRFFAHTTNTAPTVAAAMRQARRHCSVRKWEDALSSVGKLKELGQLPFASKVVAFLDLENAGVYDNRINRFLLRSCLDRPMIGCPAIPVNSKGNMNYARVSALGSRIVYQRWCERLQELRDLLNNIGPGGRWKCTESASQRWRAVDVERAIFQLANSLPRPMTGPARGKEQPARSVRAGAVVRVPSNAPEGPDPNDVRRRLRDHCESHPIMWMGTAA